MLTLKEIGESFTDTHPIMTMLGDYRTVITAIGITIIAGVLATLVFTEMPHDNKKMRIMFVVSSAVTVLGFTTFTVGKICGVQMNQNPQQLTYEGQAKVINVSPIKKGSVQDVTFEHKGQTYQVSQPTKVTQNINKGDKVQLKCHIKHYLKSHAEHNDYQNKDGSFKKEIKLQDHMDELKLKSIT